jgi:hypothetical protein
MDLSSLTCYFISSHKYPNFQVLKAVNSLKFNVKKAVPKLWHCFHVFKLLLLSLLLRIPKPAGRSIPGSGLHRHCQLYLQMSRIYDLLPMEAAMPLFPWCKDSPIHLH